VLDVLFEDNHLLVVAKPANLITQGAAQDEDSLVSRARAYLKHKYSKPGNVYVGVVSRLDASVSGVVVLAKTSKAADRLNEQFRNREVEKTYWALVSGHVQPASGRLVDWLVKDERQQKVVVTQRDTPGAQEAVLTYQTKAQLGQSTWLEIALETGRKNQIRVQLAARGWPVLGDRKYGSRSSFPTGIALLARSLRLRHPTKQEEMTFTAAPSASWPTT
jgi:23S rRNA pseudouridine1911/1915/1917 synthase